MGFWQAILKEKKGPEVFLSFGVITGLIAAGFMAGCTHKVPVDITLPQPLVTRVPVVVGLYYTPELRAHEYVSSVSLHTWKLPLGPPSVALFDQIFGGMFDKVVHVDNRPPLPPGEPDLAGVIEPRIDAFATGVWSDAQTTTITYHLTLYSLCGDEVASWTVRGTGKSSLPGLATTLLREPTQRAMRDAAASLIRDFHHEPRIQKWLENLKHSPNSLPAKCIGVRDSWRQDR